VLFLRSNRSRRLPLPELLGAPNSLQTEQDLTAEPAEGAERKKNLGVLCALCGE